AVPAEDTPKPSIIRNEFSILWIQPRSVGAGIGGAGLYVIGEYMRAPELSKADTSQNRQGLLFTTVKKTRGGGSLPAPFPPFAKGKVQGDARTPYLATMRERERDMHLPDWAGKIILGAAFAALGYVAKDVYRYLKERRGQHGDDLTKLRELQGLLHESGSLFRSQNDQVRRLLEMLQHNHPGQVSAEMGFDEAFFRASSLFNLDEKELQLLIRGLTQNPMRSVNERMRLWLAGNPRFKTWKEKPASFVALAEQLRLLELHLIEWQNKYDQIFARDATEGHSLVYLADQKKQGHG